MRGGFFYNTNGFAFHRLDDALAILADLGYDGVAWTPDVHHLDPLRASHEEVVGLRRTLERRGLACVIETGARFLLDPVRKHRPTLLDPPAEAERRLRFLRRCVEVAEAVGAPVVTLWSGAAPPGQAAEVSRARLVDSLRALCDDAVERGVRIGFEPEPGMEIDTLAGWREVRDEVAHPALGLTLDVGHCLATREGDPADLLRAHASDLLVLQLDDHRSGVHEHLAFGEGEVDFARVAEAVAEVGFDGPLEVELSRHSATAPEVARRSLEFLRRVFRGPPHAARPS